jgi:hypothetical protein
MKYLYNDSIHNVLTADRIDLIISDKKRIEKIVIDAINEKFNSEAGRVIEGSEFIIRDILIAYVLKILWVDKSFAPFEILHLESLFSFYLSVSSGGSDTVVLTGGKVDRIDLVQGVTRIVDYKTGIVADRIISIEDLFADARKKDTDAWLQTLLYCEAYLVNNQGVVLRPSVYKVRKLKASSDNDRLRIKIDTKSEIIVDDYQSVRDEFIKKLKEVIADIFSHNEPFIMTDDIRGKCSYCPYRRLCIR